MEQPGQHGALCCWHRVVGIGVGWVHARGICPVHAAAQIYGDIWKQLQEMQAAQDSGASAPTLTVFDESAPSKMPSIDATPFAATMPSTEVGCCHCVLTCYHVLTRSYSLLLLTVCNVTVLHVMHDSKATRTHTPQSSATAVMPSLIEDSAAAQDTSSTLSTGLFVHPMAAFDSQGNASGASSLGGPMSPTALEQLSGRCVVLSSASVPCASQERVQSRRD